MSPSLGVSIVLILAMGATGAEASLREALAPYVDFAPTDTLRSLSPSGDSKVLLSRSTKNGPRNEEIAVSIAARKDLLEMARLENLLMDSAAAVAIVPLEDRQKQNRKQFTGGLSGLGALAFGSAILIGVQPDDPGVAMTVALVSYPASLGLHHLYARDRIWTDAHLEGATYGATSAYLGSLATVFALGGFDHEESWRAASLVGLVAYPIGVHWGYAYGQGHLADPGRVGLTSSLAWQGAFTGALIPIAIADWKPDAAWSPTFQGSAVGFVGGGALGHVLGSVLHTNEPVPTGTGIGTSVLASLGAWTGLGVGLLQEDPSANTTAALIVAGNTLGTVGGYRIATRRRDTRERAMKIGMGMAIGSLVSSCVSTIAVGYEDDASLVPVVALPLSGAWAGYGLATLFTEPVDQSRDASSLSSSKDSWIRDVNVSPFAFPSRTARGTRWTWPGVVVSLR